VEESWRDKVTSLVALEKILHSNNQDIKAETLERVLKETIHLALNSPSSSTKNQDFLTSMYSDPKNIASYLCKSSLFQLARPDIWPSAPTASVRQLSAQLHVLCGMEIETPWPTLDELSCPHIPSAFTHLFGTTANVTTAVVPENGDGDGDDDDDEDWEDQSSTHSTADESSSPAASTDANPNVFNQSTHPLRYVHPYARSRVYDLRRYKASNFWGPFTDDGTQAIDWEKVQSIMIVLAYNLRMYTERSSRRGLSSQSTNSSDSPRTGAMLWEEPFQGIGPGSFTPHPLEEPLAPRSLNPDLDALDPYGVTGTWTRIVCFLDYNDLYAFNFESGFITPLQERQPITTREAFRLIKLQLRVTAVEEPGEDDGKEYPVVHFEGMSKSTFMAWDPNANSRIRGIYHRPLSFPFPPNTTAHILPSHQSHPPQKASSSHH
jgi:hypothetical protein